MWKQVLKAVIITAAAGAYLPVNAQDVAWATGIGGDEDDRMTSICTDPEGNVISLGTFTNVISVTLKDGTRKTIHTNGDDDILVVKQNAEGDYLWVNAYGSTQEEFANAITSDDEGNIYFTGMFGDNIDFNPGGANGELTLQPGSGYNMYITKLDAAGDFVWAKKVESSLLADGYGIGVDKEHNVYVTGEYMGVMTFDPGDPTTVHTSNITQDMFLLKLKANADYDWGYVFSEPLPMPDRGSGLDVDEDGNVYITGSFYPPMEFNFGSGTDTLKSPSGQDYVQNIFVAKYTTNGDHVWAVNLESKDGLVNAYDLKLDGLGNLFIAGEFSKTVDFNPEGNGTDTLMAYGSWDGFALKMDTAGRYQWAQQLGGTLGDIAYGVMPDKAGNVYVTGHVGSDGFIDGDDTLHAYGRIDLFVSKLAAEDGKTMWVNVWGGVDEEAGNGITVDASGNAYTAGYYESSVDFNIGGVNKTLTAKGSKDMLTFRIDCADTSSASLTIPPVQTIPLTALLIPNRALTR